MGREIKFRAWDRRYEVMIPQVVPYQPSIIVLDIMFNEAYGSKADERSENGTDDGGPEHICITDESIVLMQFTGLKDKSGVDIYEGDILKWTSWKTDKEPYNNVVEFFSGGQSCGFRIRNKSFMKSLTGNGVLNAKAIVIGNIYQNPELLNEKAD